MSQSAQQGTNVAAQGQGQGHAGPSPALLFQTMNAFQQTAALKGALDLDLFTAVGEGNKSAGAVAKRCGASERGVRILCDYLALLGFLTKDAGGEYALTQDSALFLDRRSPACMADAALFLNSSHMYSNFDDVAGAVRRGGTMKSGQGSMDPEHPMWVDFARGMAPMMMMPAQMMAELLVREEDRGREVRILDIAAGHGVFGIELAKRMPKARVVAVDWAPVLEVARENATAAGVADRYESRPGSAFDVVLGSGYDIVLMTNFLHHFDAKTNEVLLRKMCDALKPGGRCATLEFVPNDDRVTPPDVAGFSLIMLASTQSGDAYTFAELDAMMKAAGFAKNELFRLEPTPQSLVISTKA